MVSRYDAILAGIPTSLVGGVAGDVLFAGVAGTVPFVLGLVVSLALVGRALLYAPAA